MSNACLTLPKRIWSNVVRIGEELVVVELDDERDLVRVLAGHRARARRALRRPRCSRLRSPASRCSRDRSRPGSARTTRRRSARCPDRPAGSTRSRCRPAGRVSNSDCRLRSTRRRPVGQRDDRGPRSRAREGAGCPSGWSCTDAQGAHAHLQGSTRCARFRRPPRCSL